jgi:hypothetical protein
MLDDSRECIDELDKFAIVLVVLSRAHAANVNSQFGLFRRTYGKSRLTMFVIIALAI